MLNQDVKIEISPCWTRVMVDLIKLDPFWGGSELMQITVHSDDPCTLAERWRGFFEVGSIMPWVLQVIVTNKRFSESPTKPCSFNLVVSAWSCCWCACCCACCACCRCCQCCATLAGLSSNPSPTPPAFGPHQDGLHCKWHDLSRCGDPSFRREPRLKVWSDMKFLTCIGRYASKSTQTYHISNRRWMRIDMKNYERHLYKYRIS